MLGSETSPAERQQLALADEGGIELLEVCHTEWLMAEPRLEGVHAVCMLYF